MHNDLALEGYDPDSGDNPAVAFHIQMQAFGSEVARHQHRKGQLILALHGGVTCEVEGAMWIVPPQHAVWIPGGMPHMNRVTANAQICFLFIAPGALAMPTRCCTLRVSPLVRELILSLAERGIAKLAEPKTRRLVQVLFDELPQQPAEHLHLPVSGHPKIQIIVAGMAHEPENGAH